MIGMWWDYRLPNLKRLSPPGYESSAIIRQHWKEYVILPIVVDLQIFQWCRTISLWDRSITQDSYACSAFSFQNKQSIGCWSSKVNIKGHFWAWSVKTLVFPKPTGYMLASFGLFYLNGEYSAISSKMICNFPEFLNFSLLVLELNWFICN